MQGADAKTLAAGLGLHFRQLAFADQLALLQGEEVGRKDVADDVGLAHISNIRQLESLTMSACEITDEGLAHISKLVELKIVQFQLQHLIPKVELLKNRQDSYLELLLDLTSVQG